MRRDWMRRMRMTPQMVAAQRMKMLKMRRG
jgi:hypothetical protein